MFAVTVPSVAVTVTVPVVTAVNKPCDPTVLLMVAIDVLSTDHVTPVVMSDCEPLLKFPCAVNCCVWVCGIMAPAGVIAIEVSDGGFTVTLDDPERPLELAEMVALPGETPTTKPVPLTVAILGVLELQVAVFVIVWGEPPLLVVQVAAICCVCPTPTLPVLGVTLTAVQLLVDVKKSPQPTSHAAATRSAKIAISDRVLMVPQKLLGLQDT